MTRYIVQVPKIGDPSPFVCPKCDQLLPNESLSDQTKIHRHMILHVPDSTTRWDLMDELFAEQARNDLANSAFA
jgi:hypothetical protein